jgi:hypothetical protein
MGSDMINTGLQLLRVGAVTALIALPALGSAGSATAAPTPEPAPTADTALQSLLGRLPNGYTPGDCRPHNPPDVQAALAQVICGADHDPGGPARAYIYIFSNTADMDAAFNNTVANSTLQPFPDGSTGPATWSYAGTPKQVAGSQAFVTFADGSTHLMWTDDARLLGAAVTSTDNAALLNWFFTDRR